MAWRGDPARLTKLAYAERLVAAMALLLLRQRDAVGLVRFDDLVRTSLAPRVRSGQWQRIVAALDDPGAGHASHAAAALEQAWRLIPRRGLVVIVSDLLMDADEILSQVRALRHAGHQLVVQHVLDPAELDLPAAGDALFFDPESGAEVPAASERDTSYVKSTCPGVSMRFSSYDSPSRATYVMRTAFSLIVMPRSRSRSSVSVI
jgi:uncharacterized protein (DUF58 family)